MPGQTYKLALIGESGAGKTTCIASVSDIPPMSTDVPHTTLRSSDKTTTTVAFDYGEMILDEDHRLLLYGLPGQSEFDFMFNVVQEGLLASLWWWMPCRTLRCGDSPVLYEDMPRPCRTPLWSWSSTRPVRLTPN